jgi:hypothetical protein
MLKKKMVAKLNKILETAESFGLVLGSGTLRFRFTRGVLRIGDRTINTSNSAAWTDISPNSAFRNETNHWLNTSPCHLGGKSLWSPSTEELKQYLTLLIQTRPDLEVLAADYLKKSYHRLDISTGKWIKDCHAKRWHSADVWQLVCKI